MQKTIEDRKGKIIQYLSRYSRTNFDDKYTTHPFDITTDGIAAGIGLARTSTIRYLAELEEEGSVEWKLGWVKGYNKRRKRVHRLRRNK